MFFAINLLVLVNSVLHNPEWGYDANHHLSYMQVLPTRLPEKTETNEFFSPPLPYFLPSLVNRACLELVSDGTFEDGFNCSRAAGKFWQMINLGLSIGLTLLLVHLFETLCPSQQSLKLSSLVLISLVPTYYKTMSQARGEPYVVFFVFLVLFLFAQMVTNRQRLTWRSGFGLGLALAGLVLSRQWGFFLFPAIIVFSALVLLLRLKSIGFGKAVFAAVVVSFLAGSWFYFYLYFNFGSFTAFNMNGRGFRLSNHPTSFYRSTGLERGLLFKVPVRKNFDNTFFPILYSDTWGDYWGYFVFVNEKSDRGLEGFSNRDIIAPYLGRVNLVSIYPSLLFGAGFLLGAAGLVRTFRMKNDPDPVTLFQGFLFLVIVFSFIGYAYFIISYPQLQGDTIKATYMLHMILTAPLLAAFVLEALRKRVKRAYTVAMLGLLLVGLHNLPAMITRFPMY
jgi:hypothetical protein